MFDDQIGERLEGAQTFLFTNLLLYSLTSLRFFAPGWWCSGPSPWMQRDLPLLSRPTPTPDLVRASGWPAQHSGVLTRQSGASRSRYLLPTYPLLALLLADLLRHHTEEFAAYRAARSVQWLFSRAASWSGGC
ncbi:MAG: hypothetical protein U0361_15440 [Nitrospiraceae bacterium]